MAVSGYLFQRADLFVKFVFPLLVLFVASSIIQGLIIFRQASGRELNKSDVGMNGNSKAVNGKMH